MKFCNNCGQQLADNDTVCAHCGAVQTVGQPGMPAQQPFQQPYQASYQQAYTQQPPMTEQPVSTGAWIGYMIVAGIPLVGLIVLLVLAFGNGSSQSLKNWARAQLIVALIVTLLSIIVVGVFGAAILKWIDGGYAVSYYY